MRASTATRTAPRRTRAQTEPLAAIAAVFAVCLGLSLYALAVPGGSPVADERSLAEPTDERSIAEPTLGRASATLVEGGVVDPDERATALDAAPDGHELRISILADGETWRVGPEPPDHAAVAAEPVSVRVGPGQVRPGRLVVEVWR